MRKNRFVLASVMNGKPISLPLLFDNDKSFVCINAVNYY